MFHSISAHSLPASPLADFILCFSFFWPFFSLGFPHFSSKVCLWYYSGNCSSELVFSSFFLLWNVDYMCLITHLLSPCSKCGIRNDCDHGWKLNMFYAALEQTFILVQQCWDSGLMMRVVLFLVPVSRLLLQQGSKGHLTRESEIMEEFRFHDATSSHHIQGGGPK